MVHVSVGLDDSLLQCLDDRLGGRVRLDLPRRLDEGDAVAVVLLDAGCHGKDVGVEAAFEHLADDLLARRKLLAAAQLEPRRHDHQAPLPDGLPPAVGALDFVVCRHVHARDLGVVEPLLDADLVFRGMLSALSNAR